MEVAHVDVTTNAQVALAMAASDASNSAAETAGKRRNIAHGGLKFSSSSYVQLESRRRRILKDDDGEISPPSIESQDSYCSPNSGQLAASCCSSNRSSELDEERRSPVDLEVESAEVDPTSTCNCSRGSREMSPSNELRFELDEQKPTAKSLNEHSCRKKPTVGKTPTELELEEFFTAAEKEIQKKFEAKYNYDIMEDVPLEGRYEWVPLKQKQ